MSKVSKVIPRTSHQARRGLPGCLCSRGLTGVWSSGPWAFGESAHLGLRTLGNTGSGDPDHDQGDYDVEGVFWPCGLLWAHWPSNFTRDDDDDDDS